MTPVRLQLSRARGFRLQAHSLATNGLPAVKVDRSTKWGNPFVVDHLRPTPDGKPFSVWREEDHSNGFFGRTLVKGYESLEEATRYAVGFFHAHLMSCPREKFDAIRSDLAGKNLACWCKPAAVCHADVLLKIANEPPKDTP